MQAGAGLDLVSHRLGLDHNTALGRVARASAPVNQEARAAAHVVGGVGVQVVAVVHALESAHIAEGVGTSGQGAHSHFALTESTGRGCI